MFAGLSTEGKTRGEKKNSDLPKLDLSICILESSVLDLREEAVVQSLNTFIKNLTHSEKRMFSSWKTVSVNYREACIGFTSFSRNTQNYSFPAVKVTWKAHGKL